MLKINTKPSLYRDFALLSALIIFILFLVSIWVSYETYQEHSADVMKQLENEAVRIDRALIIEIERASYLLESIGRQVSLFDTNNLKQIQQLYSSFDKGDQPQNSEFFWVTPDQEMVLSSSKGILEKPVNVSDRDYMKKVITAPWVIHIGQPVEGRVSQKWVMPLAIGLTDDENHFMGAVVISLDINSFSSEIRDVIKAEGVSFAITNQAFTLLTELSDQEDFFLSNFQLNALSKIDFTEKTNGIFSYANLFEPNKIYSYYEKSSQYPYIIFVGYDAGLSRAAIRDILLPRLLQITVITIFLVSILWTVRKRIIQPVIDLTASTAEIVRGKPFNPQQEEVPVEIEHLTSQIKRIAHYIDERKRIERELSAKNLELLKIRESAEMTNEIKAQFFEQVGSALMQPATTITEYAESMKNELFGPLGSQKYSEIADKMYLQVGTIIDLLNEILSISRAESGLLSLEESDVEIPLMLKKCMRILQDRMRYKAIEIIQDYDEDLPLVRADELRIKQLFLNVLSAACNKLSPGDVIRIRIHNQRDGFMIRIEYVLPEPMDEEEMDMELPAAVQQPSYDSVETPIELGFALNQLIVAMHNGTIHMKTNADRRVTIMITFPEQRVIPQA